MKYGWKDPTKIIEKQGLVAGLPDDNEGFIRVDTQTIIRREFEI